MADDDHWDENTRQRLRDVTARHLARGTRTRPDPLTTIPTPSAVVADSFGSGPSSGPPPERVAPLGGHADSRGRG